MIKTEIITINNKEYKRTYSDENFYIQRDGEIYAEAIDPINRNREYTETDISLTDDII